MKKTNGNDYAAFERQWKYRAGVFEKFGVDPSYHELLREVIRDCDHYNPCYPETKDDCIPVPQEKRDELARLDASGIVEPILEVPVEVDKNCRAETHIKAKHWLVYNKTVVWSHSKDHPGVAKLSCRALAKYCGMPYRTVADHIKWLVERGWLEVIEPSKQGGAQLDQQGTYRPVTHDEWVNAHGTGACLKACAGKRVQVSKRVRV